MYGLEDHTIRQIRDIFQNYNEIDDVILFGSRATGTHKPSSDIDFAIKGRITEKKLQSLKMDLEDLPTPYQFDIILYSSITHKLFLDHIDGSGSLFYKKT